MARLWLNTVGCQMAASIGSPTNQRKSRLKSICSINCRSERTEKNACNKVARSSISGGMEGRPIVEYIASNRPSNAASTASVNSLIARDG